MSRLKLIQALVAMALTAGASASLQAEYRDAIDLPSLRMESVRYSLLLDIADTGEQLVAIGERGHVLLSQDDGRNWTQSQVPTRLQLNAVSFVDKNTGWVVGEDELILKTTDGGNTWQQQHEGRNAERKGPLLDIFFKNAKEGFAIGVFNKMFHTADGGATWDSWQAHIENPDEWHLIAMASTGANSETLYITSEMGLLFRSTDGGESFEPLQTDHDGSFHGIIARRGSNGLDQLVLVGVGGILYTTLDGGDTWNSIETHTEAGLASATWLSDGGVLVVGADGVVIQLDANLQKAKTLHTDSGLALSSVVQLDRHEALMVGFGGVHRLELD
ncbi:YCF48-related protein [Pseudomonas sp. MPC6]|uniref:WD40/YVTN/BNR-like repeat-containing protein n=1 Tax=unclassified Pseudomonas TaxID=196821 RepID=UPI001110DF53|nr:YCF48-related protein [Pseudomonas sp. MPC6]QCY09443.1 hypothetical protein ELQ88_00955 [Pseudomonas sp. MPC6]